MLAEANQYRPRMLIGTRAGFDDYGVDRGPVTEVLKHYSLSSGQEKATILKELRLLASLVS